MTLASFCGKKTKVGKLGSAHATKSVNNILNTAHLMIATEGMLALKAAGVDVSQALQCVNESSGRSLQTEVRVPEEVLSRRFNYGFDLQLMQKDVSFARKLIVSAHEKALLAGGTSEEGPASGRVLLKVAEIMDAIADDYKTKYPGCDYTYEGMLLFREDAGYLIEAGGNGCSALVCRQFPPKSRFF